MKRLVLAWSIRPAAYPIPMTAGRQDAEAQGRPPRAWPMSIFIGAPGHQTLVTHVFAAGDPYLDSDVVFGVSDSLIVNSLAAGERPRWPR